MKNPISILRHEHEQLLEAIAAARSVLDIESIDEFFRRSREIIIFFRNYTELYHFPKEENIFYPALRDHATQASEAFLHQLCDNHEDFKSLMAQMEQHYVNHDHRQLKLTMKEYFNELESHMLVEEDTVLNKAGKFLTNEELDRLGSDFEKHDERYDEREDLDKSFYKLKMGID